METSSKISLQAYSKVTKLMGNRFEFTVVSGNAEWAKSLIHEAIAEVQRIERLFTTFNEASQVNAINKNAGSQPVKVDREVIELIQRSLKISEITQGAFDITYGGIDKSLWNFDTTMTSLPDPQTAQAAVRLINYKNVLIDEKASTVFLKYKGMRIGFGGIGKGYAADRAKKLLQSKGVESGIVNAAGDLTTWGNRPDGQPWTIGIADPNQVRKALSTLQISNMAVATSGNYEKFAIIDGRKYSHTIDPTTGLPVSGIKSVTIICPSAELADAMATPVMVMGIRVGLDLINQLNMVGCIIIDDQDRMYCSDNIKISKP